MKKVWVLEKWRTVEEMKDNLDFMLKDDFEGIIKPETIAAFEEDIKRNPNGKWAGWEGKTNYKAFCEVAKDALRRAEPGDEFRVVTAEIDDDAKYWINYKNPVENAGVLRYLYATK